MTRWMKFPAWCVLAVLTLSLIACGGGGGGGGAPALSLTGTVSDSTQVPVNGATVTAYNNTGTAIAMTATNGVGRFNFYGLPVNAALTFKVTGPAGTFPAQAEKVTLAAGVVTVLDFYLPSSGPATESLALPDNWESQAQIAGPRRTVVDLSASTLSATPTAIYAAPFDVSQIGDGYPVDSVSPLAVGVDEIVEFYAAAAFSISGATFDQADLYLPVPPPLDAAAVAADLAATTILYRFNETTSAWVAEAITPTLTTDPINGSPAFSATVTQPGYYRVGAEVAAAPVTGTLTYSGGATPAAGVTVYATGSDHGYQQVLVTDALGQFTALVKTGGTTAYTFTAWGFGVELSQTSATASATLDFAKPTYGVPATARLTLDDAGIPPNDGPDSIGLIVASGRLSSDPLVIDGTVQTPGRADVSFNVSSFDGSLSLNATTKGSGIQLGAAGQTFANLAFAPAAGYLDYTTFASIPIPTTIPAGGLLILVKTSAGYAKISIDSVSETPPASGDWVITYRSAFSLTGSF